MHKNINFSSIQIMIFLSPIIFLSGCIGHVGPRTGYDINITDGMSNIFYKPGNDTSERYKNEIAYLSIDEVYVFDFLEKRCYPVDSREWSRSRLVNQSAGSWKFIEIWLDVANNMVNRNLRFYPSLITDTDGFKYPLSLNNDFCGQDFCLIGNYDRSL